MKPPALAQALLAAVASTDDFEIVAGDLHEEYVRLVHSRGAKAADSWYWGQVLRSIPSLLFYHPPAITPLRRVTIALTAFGVLLAMVVTITVIQTVLFSLFGVARIPSYALLFLNYGGTVSFGAILAVFVRGNGLRVTFFAALFLVLCFVIPALAGNPHSQAPLYGWIVLIGVIPTMCLGAALYQAATAEARVQKTSRSRKGSA
jgi:hypothetical protein